MYPRRSVLFLALLLLLSGCAGKPVLAPPGPSSSEVPTPYPTPPPTARPTPAGVQQADSAFRHFAYDTGAEVGDPGIFFMSVRTGKVEGYGLMDDLRPTSFNYYGSPDGNFVLATDQRMEYLLNRRTGAAYKWARDQLMLAGRLQNDWILTAHADRLLLAETNGIDLNRNPRQTGRFLIVDGQMQTVASFTLEGSSEQPAFGLFAPDADGLAIVWGGKLYLVETETGKVSFSHETPKGTLSGLANEQDGQHFQLEVLTESLPVESREILTFTWSGRESEWYLLHGRNRRFSPDGKLLAIDEPDANGQQTVFVYPKQFDHPLMTLTGATMCFSDYGNAGDRWLADSSGLVVRTRDGYRLLSVTDGILKPLPFAQTGEPIPSRTQPSLFAVGRLGLYDGRTGAQYRVTTASHPAHLLPWQATDDELRFATAVASGHEALCNPDMILGQSKLAVRPK